MAKSQAQSQSTAAEDQPEWSRVTTGTEGTSDADIVNGELVQGTGGSMMGRSPAMMTVVQWCAERVSHTDQDESAAMEDIVRRVLASDTPDKVFEENLTVDVSSILGKPVTILGFRVAETEFTEGFPFYALVDCRYGNPQEDHVVTVGAFKVMAQLMALDRLGAWPQVCMFKEADRATRNGYKPVSLVRAV